VTPHLSIIVQEKESPVTKGELPKINELGAKLAVKWTYKAPGQLEVLKSIFTTTTLNTKKLKHF
jgi:hypothetical protein